jgi:hypothetical protein
MGSCPMPSEEVLPKTATRKAATALDTSTFSTGIRLLPSDLQADARHLYHVLRTIDDLVDNNDPQAECRVQAPLTRRPRSTPARPDSTRRSHVRRRTPSNPPPIPRTTGNGSLSRPLPRNPTPDRARRIRTQPRTRNPTSLAQTPTDRQAPRQPIQKPHIPRSTTLNKSSLVLATGQRDRPAANDPNKTNRLRSN